MQGGLHDAGKNSCYVYLSARGCINIAMKLLSDNDASFQKNQEIYNWKNNEINAELDISYK